MRPADLFATSNARGGLAAGGSLFRGAGIVSLALAGALVFSACGNTASTEELAIAAGLGQGPAAAPGQVAAADPGALTTTTDVSAGGVGVPAPASGTVDVGATDAGTTGAGATDAGATGAGSKKPGKSGSGGNAVAATDQTKVAAPDQAKADGVKAPVACTGTKSPIIIGSVGQITGVLGTLFVDGTRAVAAWAAMHNAAGGLACHPVKYIAVDDGGDPSRHLALVRKLVEQDKVIAMVFSTALLTGATSKDYLISKGIPTIGNQGGELYYFEPKARNFFHTSSSGEPLVDWTMVAAAREANTENKKTVGILTCQEVVFCNLADTNWREIGERAGLTVKYQGKASLLNVDFTSQCLAAKNAGVQTLVVAFDTSGIERIASSCAAVNFKPLIAMTSVQSGLAMIKNPDLAGGSIAQPLRPWFLTDSPAIRNYQAQMAKFAPGVAIDSSSINGWAAATLFSRAAPAFAADTVTSAGILKALWQVKNDDLDGLSYPLTFSETKVPEYKVCGWVVRIRPGKFESDGKMFCGKGSQ